MFIVGLSGGIGSGKTTAGKLFEKKGVAVVDADDLARAVVAPGTEGLNQIIDRFGKEVLTPQGALNRALLREKIFSKPPEKQWLESLIHPLVFEASQQAFRNTHAEYGIYISPLLIEKGIPSWIDRVLIIECEQNTQIDRASQRDNNTPEQIKAIMANQANADERKRYANDILYNSGDLNTLATQVESLHQKYLSLAEQF